MPILEDLRSLRVTAGNGAKIFVIGSDATGDITHVYAAFKAGKVTGLVVFKWNADADGMKSKFTDLGVPADRIKTVDLAVNRPTKPDLEAFVKDLFPPNAPNSDQKKQIEAASKPILAARNDHRDCLTGMCRALKFSVPPLHESTTLALTALQDEKTRKALHVDLRGTKGLVESDELLVTFWQDRIAKFDQDIVVLWGRRSGKAKTTVGAASNLGPHLYGDSSTTGLVQIAEKCKEFAKVVVAGDVDRSKKDRFQGCLYIGEFWNDLNRVPYKVIAVTQRVQIRTFYVLKQLLKPSGKRLVHVGMRSGNMDNYAFAGQTIVYLVPLGFDDQRIVQLSIKDENYTGKGGKDAATTKPGGANRWIQSLPTEVPRVAYRQDLEDLPEALTNVIQQTDLRRTQNQQRFTMLNESLREKNSTTDFYPIDPDTQVNANILYRAVKEAVKADQTLDPGNLLRTYLTNSEKRGFSTDYLNGLTAKIRGALKKT